MNDYVILIPARSGSKGIKNKNIIELGGKSLIDLAIDTALLIKTFNLLSNAPIIVSTDYDPKFINTDPAVYSYNKRPAELCTDKSSIFDTLAYIVKEYSVTKGVVLLEPTSPFRDQHTIELFVELIENANEIVISCKKIAGFIWRSNNSKNEPFSEDLYRRQDRPEYYEEVGTFYYFPVGTASQRNLWNDVRILLVDNMQAIDINEPQDLQFAKKVSC